MVSQTAYQAHKKMENVLTGKRFVASEFKNIILGGQDGLVNVFGLVLGVAAGTGDTKAVIIAGLAGTFAESISMAAVAYTSTKSQSHYYKSELEREMHEIETVPATERKEVRDIYAAKGFKGTLLNQVVRHITSDKKLWLDTMMKEELGLSEDGGNHAGRGAIIVGLSAVIGSLIPLAPFFYLDPVAAIPYSLVLSTLTLFATGAAEAKLTTGSWWQRGLQISVIGMLAGIAGYAVGAVLGVRL